MSKTAARKPKPTTEALVLVDQIVHAIREKKGVDIAIMHVGAIGNSATDYFVICSSGSDRQSQAIADEVEDHVRKTLNEKPWHVEGAQRGEWVLMDYINVVVHIFLPRVREFYGLEELWGDAETVRHAE